MSGTGSTERCRIDQPLPLIVRGRDRLGRRFESSVYAETLNPREIRFQTTRNFDLGTELFFLICFEPVSASTAFAPRVAARGVVLESATGDGRNFKVAARLTRHRFL